MNQSRPATPGQILEREFLAPYGITQTDLATHTGWTRKHVNQLCRGRVPVTVDSAFILAAATRTEPEYWLGLQSVSATAPMDPLGAQLMEPRSAPIMEPFGDHLMEPGQR